jgi:hypothetical protein
VKIGWDVLRLRPVPCIAPTRLVRNKASFWRLYDDAWHLEKDKTAGLVPQNVAWWMLCVRVGDDGVGGLA